MLDSSNAQAVAMTIAGSDCSGGAGIQADLKTFRALDVYGLTAITCVVAETANEVRSIHAIPDAFVADQIDILLSSYPVGAIKLGMLWSADIAALVADRLERTDIPVVIDPVMVASTGDSLIDPATLTIYRERLIPRAKVITPNLPEARRLLGLTDEDSTSPHDLAKALYDSFNVNILLKGGHGSGAESIDLLYDGHDFTGFSLPRLNTPSAHGTGCTFAAALTAGLAKGHSLTESSRAAKHFVHAAISSQHCWFKSSEREIRALNQ